ncbi:phospholipase D family protein [Helicobacter aurati]|nr:phospholipase D family protein [Helicobacter aurati]
MRMSFGYLSSILGTFVTCLSTFLFAALIILILTACSPLTSINHSTRSDYMPQYNTFTSPIATPYKEELRGNQDGALIIADGTSALLHRLAFVQMAQRSIDIQTYIYKNELTSRLLLYELYKAADRGVKIRILIDDNGISSDFYDIMQLDSHKNIEVRIFNPYFFRFEALRAFEALFDFSRINKRMHNKLFIFDDTALIAGGRNIADAYFDNASVNFTDTDLLFIGNIAKDAKLNFEQFWNYKRSIPANLFPSERTKRKYSKKAQSLQATKKYRISNDEWEEYLRDIEEFKTKYYKKEFHISWGDGIFLADLPDKVDRGNDMIKTPILDALMYNLNQAKHSIVISSSYLVPGLAALDSWKRFIERGIDIQILTNSLAAIDVIPVYSHWENYRDKIALMGAKVYEYPNFTAQKARLKNKAKFYNAQKSKVSLHSKNMIIDDRIIAVGSFNLDYRSAMLNTESIVFFKSQELAKQLKQITEAQMAESYAIVCDSMTKRCHWELSLAHSPKSDFAKSEQDTQESMQQCVQKFYHSPNTSLWLRIYKTLAKIMPEKLL